MSDQRRYGVSAAFVLLLYGLVVGLAGPAMAKGSSKKCDVQPASRMTAAIPKESHAAFSRTSTRRTHGLNASRRPSAPRSMRRSLTRLNGTRAILGQREQPLDSSRIRVIDGDTFAYGAERIRLQGFNAAEHSDPDGLEATQRLQKLLRQGRVTMIPKGTDIYGRIVAEIFVDHYNVVELLDGV
jgi:endonuclease YncB( thermonuclease family)